MSNIYERVYAALSPLGYPVKEQGTFGKDASLPDTFVTYQLIDLSPRGYADNAATVVSCRVQVALYSRKPSVKQAAPRLIKSVMKPAGFKRVSGRDLPFSQSTGHYGYTEDYRFFDMD